MCENDVLKRCNFTKPEPYDDTKIKLFINDIRGYDLMINNLMSYTVTLYGVTRNGNSIMLSLTGYKPQFKVEISDSDNPEHIIRIFNTILSKRGINKGIHTYSVAKLGSYRNTHNIIKIYLTVFFNNIEAMSKLAYALKQSILVDSIRRQFPLCENRIDTVNKFLIQTGIDPCGWISVRKTDINFINKSDNDPCYYYGFTDYTNIMKTTITETPPLLQCAFDIECYSDTRTFPLASNAKDIIICISSNFMCNNKTVLRTTYITAKEPCIETLDTLCTNADNSKPLIQVFTCKDESQMLLEWAKMMRNMCPDIIYGYNSNNFDWNYIINRALHLGIHHTIYNTLSRLDSNNRIINCEQVDALSTKAVELKLVSAGMGDNLLRFIDIAGVINIDLLKSVRDNIGFSRMRSYTLKSVLHTLGVPDKVDLSPQELFAKYTSGTPVEIAEIVYYCDRDVEGCHDIIKHKKLNEIPAQHAMANVCHIPLNYIFQRGQGVRALSLVAKYCYDNSMVVPTIDVSNDDESSYEGAMVIEPVKGIHNEPIVVIDYNSLYPSVMIAYNMSPDTVINDASLNDASLNGASLNGASLIGSYDTHFTHQYYDTDKQVNNTITFTREYTGIIPQLCKDLLNQRAQKKKQMKTATDDAVRERLDSEQLAYKLTANSVYGQMGSKFSQIAHKGIAATITGTGRKMIAFAKQVAEEDFCAQAVYGDTDSVFIKFNLTDFEHKIVTNNPCIEYIELKRLKMLEARRLGTLVAKKVSSTLNIKPINIEFEKIFYPWISFEKKMYVGYKYSDDIDNNYKEYVYNEMGVKHKKRDSAPIVSGICEHITRIIFDYIEANANNIDTSKGTVNWITGVNDTVIEYLKQRIDSIISSNEPIEQFVLTKALKSEYKTVNKSGGKLSIPAHKVLADRMTKRDPGNAPQANQRLEYVHIIKPKEYKITTLKKGTIKFGAEIKPSTSDKIEHKDYVVNRKLNIDYEYYLYEQIGSSLAPLLNPLSIQYEILFNNTVAEYILSNQNGNIIDKLCEEYNTDTITQLYNVPIAQLHKSIYIINYYERML